MNRNSIGAALALLISSVACEPIAAPAAESAAPTSARIEVGDALPDFSFNDQNGGQITPATLRGSVATLVFVVPGAAQPDALLRRVDDVYDRLGADAPRVARLLVTVQTPGQEPSLLERDGWQSLGGDPAAVAELAARFGVISWPGPDSSPVQTLGVAVIGASGVVAARFGGLETWEEMDLLVAITEAGR